jgi:3-hydroxyisobutyrate dehydrogenase-like beta-hydroxyacid dehydrogenase
MLTDADAVRTAYLGDEGALKSAEGQVFIEMSTAGPNVAAELAPRLEKAGAQYV